MTSRVDRNGPGVQLSYDGGCRARFFICSLLCNGMYICRVVGGPGIIVQFFDFEMTRHRLFRNCELYSFHCSSVTAECSPPPGGQVRCNTILPPVSRTGRGPKASGQTSAPCCADNEHF